MDYLFASELWSGVREDLVNPPRGVDLPWWPRLTELIGGMRPHELTLICAPTGAGKTQFLANLSAQLLDDGVPHFVAPVETGDVDYLKRVLSAAIKTDLNSGERWDGTTIDRLRDEQTKILNGPLTIARYDNRVEIHEMLNQLKFQRAQHGIKVALLDNLNFFLKVVSAQEERAEMDRATHEFVMLAKKLPIHIVLIVHPKKTDGGRVESEFDIKGSSTAVQEASNVMLFNRPKAEDIESGLRSWTQREVVFRKIRKRGQNVGRPIWFSYKEGRLEEQVR